MEVLASISTHPYEANKSYYPVSVQNVSPTLPTKDSVVQKKEVKTDIREMEDQEKEVTEETPKEERLVIQDLTPEEKREVQELKTRDRAVKAHEQAHNAAGGAYILRGPNYQYQTGPDGHKYAVGGDVVIDVSEVPDDPEATMKKMQAVQRAAMAPVDPSSTDRAAASRAAAKEQSARAAAAKKAREEDSQAANPVYEQQAAQAYQTANQEETVGMFFSMSG